MKAALILMVLLSSTFCYGQKGDTIFIEHGEQKKWAVRMPDSTRQYDDTVFFYFGSDIDTFIDNPAKRKELEDRLLQAIRDSGWEPEPMIFSKTDSGYIMEWTDSLDVYEMDTSMSITGYGDALQDTAITLKWIKSNEKKAEIKSPPKKEEQSHHFNSKEYVKPKRNLKTSHNLKLHK